MNENKLSIYKTECKIKHDQRRKINVRDKFLF